MNHIEAHEKRTVVSGNATQVGVISHKYLVYGVAVWCALHAIYQADKGCKQNLLKHAESAGSLGFFMRRRVPTRTKSRLDGKRDEKASKLSAAALVPLRGNRPQATVVVGVKRVLPLARLRSGVPL